MSHFVAGIIKIVLLEAHAAAVLFDRVLGNKYERHRLRAFQVLAVLMVLAWANWGALRGNQTMVHQWEQFHFYMGGKYQPEVGWFDLYPAAVLADRETTQVLGNLKEIRDNHTFELVPISTVFADQQRIRAKFSDARWAAFKADWTTMVRGGGDWGRTLQDHGNSNSPAWAIFGYPIANLLPLNRFNQTLIGLLDIFLMIGMWVFLFRTFDPRPAAAGLFVWAAAPFVFDYLSGSFLRWDWIFCLGLALGMMKRGRYATAGGFFGFAVATKLFPLFFGVALGLRWGLQWWKTRKIDAQWKRFAAGTVAAGLASVIVSSAMLGGLWPWTEYRERIHVAQVEKFYSIQYSLKTVYLQVSESAPGEMIEGIFYPREIKQARMDVEIDNHVVGFFLARVLFTLLVVVLILRADDLQAFTLGPVLVFIWLTVNAYYWNMLGLLALGLHLRKEPPAAGAAIGLNAIFMAFYLYQHTNNGAAEGYFVAVLLSFWLMAFAFFEWRSLRAARSPAAIPAPTP